MKTARNILPIAALVVAASLSGSPASADFVILDDLIVDGSACIGFDCINGESFGFDTLRLKENNLRIKALDTSTAASFPTFDWQITFNDSANGGANKFSVDDITSGRTPFTIEGSAPSNSLYVDDGGRIGIRTSTPAVEIHVIDGDTPTLRLEQDGSSGFAPQTWDVAGNETNFFIRDVTHGSQLPFRIRPDAPTSSIFIDVDGDVGFGTSSPEREIHIRKTDAASTGFTVENANAAAQNIIFDMTNSAGSWRFRSQTTGDFQIIDNDSSTTRLNIDQTTGQFDLTGDLVISGSCTTGGVACDLLLEPEHQVESIEEHAAFMWENSHLPGVGPTPLDSRWNIGKKSAGMLNELEKAHIYIERLHEATKQNGSELAVVNRELRAQIDELIAFTRAQQQELAELRSLVGERGAD